VSRLSPLIITLPDLEAIKDMTPEETAAYYKQRAAQFQVGQATRVEK
jgi:hypothetical protein